MALARIQIRNLRILESVELEPEDGINLVVGPNGAGKTSILEGIYLLGRGRSFRSSQVRPVVREGSQCIEVVGWGGEPGKVVAGLRKCVHATEIRINGESVARMSELARLFPVQLVTPRSHELLERGPEVRRRFLDWGLFHVEPSYLGLMARYQRVLRQRNEALKNAPRTATVWNEQMATYGSAIQAAREKYLATLSKALASVTGTVAPGADVELSLARGWPAGQELADVLDSRLDTDGSRGYTSAGPHRADLVVRAAGADAADRLSRGQQKLVVLSLILAQMRLLAENSGRRPLLLVDDLAAELDAPARTRVVGYLVDLPGQVFIATLPGNIPDGLSGSRVFHVEHGRIAAIDTF